MPKNEKETRLELIDPKLKAAGWDILYEKYLIEKNKACIETPVTGFSLFLQKFKKIRPESEGYRCPTYNCFHSCTT